MDVLTKQQYKQYQNMSRYQKFPIFWHSIDNRYTSGTTSQLSQNCTYKLHEVALSETLDDIALYYYGNPIYYWVIADFNHIQNPFDPLDAGSYIKIPSISDITWE